ncbi:myotrophin-like [Ptychodera flava]|uniref:myotrophin-like n=1 Tax=Ptychodera flava TaxID=63121 RepID=UPI003969D150
MYVEATHQNPQGVILLVSHPRPPTCMLRERQSREDNSMPVHLAAAEGQLDIVKYFIKTLGIDKEVKGQDNKTPLIYAAEGGRSEVVKYLLGIGADIEAVTSTKDTPLTWAAYKGHPDVVRILIDAGANKQACDEKNDLKLNMTIIFM